MSSSFEETKKSSSYNVKTLETEKYSHTQIQNIYNKHTIGIIDNKVLHILIILSWYCPSLYKLIVLSTWETNST